MSDFDCFSRYFEETARADREKPIRWANDADADRWLRIGADDEFILKAPMTLLPDAVQAARTRGKFTDPQVPILEFYGQNDLAGLKSGVAVVRRLVDRMNADVTGTECLQGGKNATVRSVLDAVESAAKSRIAEYEKTRTTIKDVLDVTVEVLAKVYPPAAAIAAPIAGLFKSIINTFKSEEKNLDGKAKALSDWIGLTIADGFPVIWDAGEEFKRALGQGSAENPAGRVVDDTERNLALFRTLPEEYQLPVKRWMLLFLKHQNKLLVRKILNCTQASRGLSNDALVLLVAAPIAIEFGIPFEDLAATIWDHAPTWEAEPILQFTDTGIASRSSEWLKRLYDVGPYGNSINARQIHYSTMAETGFRAVKGEIPISTGVRSDGGSSTPSPSSSGGSSAVVPVAGAALGLGILLLLL